MKRSGIGRGDVERARDWQRRSAERAQQNAREKPRAPLQRRTELARAATPARDQPAPAKRSRPRRPPPEQPGRREAVQRWRAAVLGDVDSRLDAHHVVPRQVLVRIARSRKLTGEAFWAVVYDPRIGLALTPRRHEQHTNRSRQIMREDLPEHVVASALAAIAEYGPEARRAFDVEHPPRTPT